MRNSYDKPEKALDIKGYGTAQTVYRTFNSPTFGNVSFTLGRHKPLKRTFCLISWHVSPSIPLFLIRVDKIWSGCVEHLYINVAYLLLAPYGVTLYFLEVWRSILLNPPFHISISSKFINEIKAMWV